MAKSHAIANVCFKFTRNTMIIRFVCFLRLPTYQQIYDWLINVKWTPEFAAEFQQFYNTAQRQVFYGGAATSQTIIIPTPPAYKDLPPDTCSNKTTTD